MVRTVSYVGFKMEIPNGTHKISHGQDQNGNTFEVFVVVKNGVEIKKVEVTTFKKTK